jgi:hypothetical protein
MKRYRVIQQIHGEGTKYQESIYYPQVVDSHTLNDKIEPWEFYYRNDVVGDTISFSTINEAEKFIEKQVAMEVPIKTIIHPVN